MPVALPALKVCGSALLQAMDGRAEIRANGMAALCSNMFHCRNKNLCDGIIQAINEIFLLIGISKIPTRNNLFL